jgi:hypothetical protein
MSLSDSVRPTPRDGCGESQQTSAVDIVCVVAHPLSLVVVFRQLFEAGDVYEVDTTGTTLSGIELDL